MSEFRLAACLLAAAALLSALPVSHAEYECTDVAIDKHFVLEVSPWTCNFYQPGNPDLRGIHSVFQGDIYDSEGSQVDCTLVNGSFPGPVLRMSLNDTIRVDIINSMEAVPISFHWHGMDQRDYQWADGAAYVSSCPVVPGRPQTHIFKADRPGVFFYHGHAGLEEDYGLSGGIVVDDPADPFTDLYDEEWPGLVISLRDWWRTPAGHLAQAHRYYFYEKFNPFGIPTINGRYGNGTKGFPFPVLEAAVNTCYRIRLIAGDTHWPGWNINITDAAGHPMNMTLLALSAENIHPKNMQSFSIYVAQRAELIFCTPPTAQDLNMSIWGASYEAGLCQKNVMPGPDADTNTFPIGPNCIDHFYAIIRVGGINSTAPKTANRAKLASFPFVALIDPLIDPSPIVPLVPGRGGNLSNPTANWNIKAGMTYLTPTDTQGYENYHNMFMWEDRQYQFGLPSAPYLFTNGQCGVQAPPGAEPGTVNVGYNLIKKAKKNQVVEIVFNNLTPYMHPMHLHGHRFTIIAQKYIIQAGYDPNTLAEYTCPTAWEWGDPLEKRTPDVLLHNFFTSGFTEDFPFFYGCPFNASDPTNKDYYLDNPYTTDIALVPAHSWTIVRVKIDNPGWWFLHCHILSHMVYGMGFVVDAFHASAPPIPSWVDTTCGGPCKAVNQFCGDYADSGKCVKQTYKKRDICEPAPLNFTTPSVSPAPKPTVLASPSPSPSPSPTPSPTPAPTSSPTPSPTPRSPPSMQACPTAPNPTCAPPFVAPTCCTNCVPPCPGDVSGAQYYFCQNANSSPAGYSNIGGCKPHSDGPWPISASFTACLQQCLFTAP